jgi:thioredoxin reductase
MLSWTKPYAEHEHRSTEYERFDWNSLLADQPEYRAIMPGVMDGTSYFPSRPEMERGLVAFAGRTGLEVRHGCAWESTRHEGDEFVLTTSDGEYRTPVAVFAVGVAEPWRPQTLAVEGVQQYGELRPAESYADRRVFIVGKQNSGFEIATGLLPWARQIILASPSPTRLSVNVRSLAGVRARYVQPFEDWALSGGVLLLDASIDSVARTDGVFRVATKSPNEDTTRTFEVDDVIAATGFVSPLRDLGQLGVTLFGQSKLPAQTPFWESATVPNIFFAGTIMQGSHGLRKHGMPSNSGAVQGYRYNARVLARHLAETRFGKPVQRRPMSADEVVPFLLAEATRGPELWHQRAYLARVVVMDPEQGVYDDGIQPLEHFYDDGGPAAVAMTLESDGRSDLYPCAYVRTKDARVKEVTMKPDPLLNYESEEYRRQLADAMK